MRYTLEGLNITEEQLMEKTLVEIMDFVPEAGYSNGIAGFEIKDLITYISQPLCYGTVYLDYHYLHIKGKDIALSTDDDNSYEINYKYVDEKIYNSVFITPLKTLLSLTDIDWKEHK